MMKKSMFVLCVTAVTLLCVLFASCAGDRDREAREETTEEVVTARKPSKEMTEDIYVDIMAKQLVLTGEYSEIDTEGMSLTEATQLTTELGEKIDALYEEHGVTQDCFYEFNEKIMEDHESYGPVMQRVNDRAEELMKEN